MNSRILFSLLSFAIAAVCPVAAQTAQPVAQPVLSVVVVDTLQRESQARAEFDRITEEFGRVFESRGWPVKVTFERFAANDAPKALELRMFYQGIREEVGEQVFRAWLTLHQNGAKQDFGVIQGRYLPRPGEQVDSVLRRVMQDAAVAAAKKLDPVMRALPAAR